MTESIGGYKFDFSLVERLARLFFGKGFRVMEFGQLGMRKRVFHKNPAPMRVYGMSIIPYMNGPKNRYVLRGLSEQAVRHTVPAAAGIKYCSPAKTSRSKPFA